MITVLVVVVESPEASPRSRRIDIGEDRALRVSQPVVSPPR